MAYSVLTVAFLCRQSDLHGASIWINYCKGIMDMSQLVYGEFVRPEIPAVGLIVLDVC